MKTHTVVGLSLALLTSLAAGCAADPPPPPMAPQDQPQPPPSPPQPQVGADAPQGGTQYASGEVTVGDDSNADAYQDDDPSALQDFHPALDGSGSWQDDPTYGTVWVPSPQVVGQDFAPYQTAGHWAYDNDEYVWVSDYEWGWAPFHYGRWVALDAGGWAWIPGRVYRGAWVGWGADPGYATVGWYPMGPEFVWRGGVAVGYTYAVGPRWAYCGRADVFAPNVGARVYVGAAAAGFAGRVQPIAVSAGARFAGGPAPSRLGFGASQVPHAAGNPGFAKATTFARPSTAVAAGGHMATRTTSPVSGSTAFTTSRATPTTTGRGEDTPAQAGAGATATPSHANTPAGTSTAPSRTATTSRTTTPAGQQPQPQKKKPAPQGAPSPKKSSGGGKNGGTHHR